MQRVRLWSVASRFDRVQGRDLPKVVGSEKSVDLEPDQRNPEPSVLLKRRIESVR